MAIPTTDLPPTPAASHDITGKKPDGRAPSISLGPAAVTSPLSDRSSSATPSSNGSESSYHPASPVSPGTKRKQPAAEVKAQRATAERELPPPPSRSRKMIQMKPRQPVAGEQQSVATDATERPATGKGGRKRTNNSGTTAAGRKMARKTAHSLIERRRRSKMNEEFGVLKDMIPACHGQEMHKLAILQASIEYLRYLQSCIAELKSAGTTDAAPSLRDPDAMDEDQVDSTITSPLSSHPPSAQTTRPPTSQSFRPQTSPVQLPPLSHISTASSQSSPNFTPVDYTPRPRQFSISTNSSFNFSPYILPQSNVTSPIFAPQYKSPSSSSIAGDAMRRISLTLSPPLNPHDRSQEMRPVSRTGTSLTHVTSPFPLPSTTNTSGPVGQKSERSDREAMAALLMLNHDRRSGPSSTGSSRDAGVATGGGNMPHPQEMERRVSQESGRRSAMSVKDLLSP